MKTINVRYGIGYGTHTFDFEVEDDSTPEEIEEDVRQAVEERLWWSHEVDGDPA